MWAASRLPTGLACLRQDLAAEAGDYAPNAVSNEVCRARKEHGRWSKMGCGSLQAVGTRLGQDKKPGPEPGTRFHGGGGVVAEVEAVQVQKGSVAPPRYEKTEVSMDSRVLVNRWKGGTY
ncbi:unnamed protein product [Cutaneotrichosporon oleaginosum]